MIKQQPPISSELSNLMMVSMFAGMLMLLGILLMLHGLFAGVVIGSVGLLLGFYFLVVTPGAYKRWKMAGDDGPCRGGAHFSLTE